MLHEAQCKVAELVWRRSWSRYSRSAREVYKWQKLHRYWRLMDWWEHSGNDRQTGRFNTAGDWKFGAAGHILTSALSISATIFIALLAPLLHTNSMGLVSASHTSEATIQSSRSPGQQCNQTVKPRRHRPARSACDKCVSVLNSQCF